MSGLFFLFLGAYLIYQDRPKKKRRCTSTCQGQIVDVVRKDDSVYRGERVTYAISYFPVFSYEVNGESYNSQLYFGSSKPKVFRKGDYYTIHYDPENPQDFYVVVSKRGTTIGVVCLVIGLILVLLPMELAQGLLH